MAGITGLGDAWELIEPRLRAGRNAVRRNPLLQALDRSIPQFGHLVGFPVAVLGRQPHRRGVVLVGQGVVAAFAGEIEIASPGQGLHEVTDEVRRWVDLPDPPTRAGTVALRAQEEELAMKRLEAHAETANFALRVATVVPADDPDRPWRVPLAIRAAIVNHRTGMRDIEALVSAVLEFGARET